MIVSSQTAVKGKHGFEIQICAAGTGTKYKTAPTVFEVYTPDQASFRLFLCVCYHQNRHRVRARVLFFFFFFFFAFAQQCLTKKLEGYWFLFLIRSLVWFLYTARCEFSSKRRVDIKDCSPSRGSGATVGLNICSTNIRLSTLGV